ncbi:MAG TPA: TIGR00725 family protein [Actinomycetes bacterium]|nr:TIGR00725 family protein [Actinomycetes bacterium]
MSLYVGVAGASRPEARLLDQAEVLGRRLAEAGAIVVCGGGPGVMEAVCRGAQAAGGTTVGLLPGLDRAESNPHLTISVPTGLGQGRNLLLVRSSNALIAVGGGFGTLSEIALALRTGTPVIGLATWSLHLDGRPVDAFPVASDPDTAARLALEAGTSRTRSHNPEIGLPGPFHGR